MGEYWRLWNLPVHNWFLRHMYFPLRRRKTPKGVATLLVFLVSALLHEYAIIGIFKVVSGVGFFGIICQLPIIIFQDNFKSALSGLTGNVIFWATFCVIGQPFAAVFIYFFRSQDILSF